MKASSITIIILVILCLILGFIIAMKLPCKCNEPVNSNSTANWLQTENDSLYKNNLVLNRQIRQYRDQADSLRQKLVNTKQTINALKQQQHEKVTRIDSLSSMELYDFFSKFNP